MKNKTLQRIFGESWQVTIRNPHLWFYGLLASMLISQEIFKGGFKSFYIISQFDLFLEQVVSVYNKGFFTSFISAPLAQAFINQQIHFLAISFVLAIIVFILYLAVYSQIQLIYQIDRIAGSLNFAGKMKIFGPMPPALWGMIGIHFIFRLLDIIIFVLASLPLIISLISGNVSSLILSAMVFFMIFIPGILILDIVKNYALVNKALTLRGFVDSIFYGWRLLRKNLLASFEAGALLVIIRLVLFSAIALIFAVVLIPSLTALMILISSGQLIAGSIFISLVIMVLSAVMLFTFSLYATYEHSVWVLLYKRLHITEPVSRLLGIVESFVEKLGGLLGHIGSSVATLKNRGQIAAQKKIGEISPEIEVLIDRLITTAAAVNKMARPKIMAMRREVEEMARREGEKILPKITKALSELEKSLEEELQAKKARPAAKTKRKTAK